MAGFQIKNAEGIAISINDLDEEAAAFWNKEIKEKSYADPTPEFTNPDNLEGDELFLAKMKYEFNHRNNWYDAIGWYIAESKAIEYPDTISWKNVMNAMMGNSLLDCFMKRDDIEICDPFNIPSPCMENLQGTLLYYQPYFQLIKHWKDKGYIPVRVS